MSVLQEGMKKVEQVATLMCLPYPGILTGIAAGDAAADPLAIGRDHASQGPGQTIASSLEVGWRCCKGSRLGNLLAAPGGRCGRHLLCARPRQRQWEQPTEGIPEKAVFCQVGALVGQVIFWSWIFFNTCSLLGP